MKERCINGVVTSDVSEEEIMKTLSFGPYCIIGGLGLYKFWEDNVKGDVVALYIFYANSV